MPLKKLELLDVKSKLSSLCLDHLEKLPLEELTIQSAGDEIEYHCKDAPVRKIPSLKRINDKTLPCSIVSSIVTLHAGPFGATCKAINEYLLTFFSLHDALNFRNTCKTLNSLFIKNQTLTCSQDGFRSPYHKLPPQNHYPFNLYLFLIEAQLRAALKSRVLYTSIDLIFDAQSKRVEDTIGRVISLFRYFPLKSLAIKCISNHIDSIYATATITNRELVHLAKISSLRTLILEGLNVFTLHDFDTLQHLPNLEGLVIKECRELDQLCSGLGAKNLIDIIFIKQKMPHLKTINDIILSEYESPVVNPSSEQPASEAQVQLNGSTAVNQTQTIEPAQANSSIPSNDEMRSTQPLSPPQPANTHAIAIGYYLREFCSAIGRAFAYFFAWLRGLCVRSSPNS